jgi:hypothetical protein
VDTGCARTCTRRQRQLAIPAFIALSVPRRSRPHSGDAQSHVSRSLRKQAHSKPRCRVRRHGKSTTSARKSPSSRTPGSKSDVGSGNFAAEGNKKQAWKPRGPALVTTSSGYLAYAARSLTRLSLLHKESQCDLLLSTSKATTSDMHSENPQASRSRYSRRRESMETLNWEIMGRLESFTPSRRDDHLSAITTQSNHPVTSSVSPLLAAIF